MLFKDRKEAGRKLGAALLKYKGVPNTLAIGLPRGGVLVAAEVAKILQIPLDVIVPRKIGAPLNEELAIGALIGELVWLDEDLVASVGASPSYIEKTTAKEKREAERRLALFRKNKPPQTFTGYTTLLIDDGVATGATMRASIAWMRQNRAKRIVVAVPVGPADTIATLAIEADEVICLLIPKSFQAVGQFYEHFPQTEENEVLNALTKT